MSTSANDDAPKRVHPVVTNTWIGRSIVYVIVGLMVLATVPDLPTWQRIAIMVFAATYPTLAYQIASRWRDTRLAGFSIFVLDGVLFGLAVAKMQYALIPSMALMIASFSALYLMGGWWLLRLGFLPIVIVAAFLFPFVPHEFYTTAQAPVVLSAFLMTALLAIFAIQTNELGKRLAAVRRDLREKGDQIKAQAELAASFNEVALLVNSTLDLDRVLRVITESLGKVFNFNLTAILFADKETDTLNLHSMFGDVSELTVERLRGLGIPMTERDSAFVITYQNRTPTYVPELALDRGARIGVSAQAHKLVPVKSLLVFPLVIEDEVIGVLSFSDTRDYFHLKPGDIQLIERYVTFVATAIRNARMFQSVTDARQVAEGANRAKSQFLANMSHELRTPMNAVIGYSEMLEEEARDQNLENFIPDLQRIRSAGRHLLKLINDVLDLSKIEADKIELYPEQIDTHQLIEEIASTVRPLIEENHNTLTVVRGEGLGEIFADVTKVRQVILNLLGNAAKFTEKGTIRLAVSRRHERKLDWLVIEVTDSGIGMSQEQLGRLFQPFSQADASTTRKYGGSGLGLTISKRFAEMMGGSLTAASVPGTGSTFTFRLPVHAAHRDETAMEEPSPMSTTLEMEAIPDIGPDSPVVLVIDDDIAVRDLMRRLLTREGYRVEAVADGNAGLASARELHPVIITLDVMMPGMDGWTVLAQLKADPALASIPVIMQTIVDEPQKAVTLGAAEHLTKPIDRKQLVDTIRRLRKCDNKCALILEDDVRALDAIGRFLTGEGWKVLSLGEDSGVMEAYKKYRPALVVLDLTMADEHGFDLVDMIRSEGAADEVQIIVVTPEHMSDADSESLKRSVQRIIHSNGKGLDAIVDEIKRQVHSVQALAAGA